VIVPLHLITQTSHAGTSLTNKIHQLLKINVRTVVKYEYYSNIKITKDVYMLYLHLEMPMTIFADSLVISKYFLCNLLNRRKVKETYNKLKYHVTVSA
jgi:hypothetical protein